MSTTGMGMWQKIAARIADAEARMRLRRAWVGTETDGRVTLAWSKGGTVGQQQYPRLAGQVIPDGAEVLTLPLGDGHYLVLGPAQVGGYVAPPEGEGGAPSTATYITQTGDAGLSAEQALSSLSTGLVKVTTGTGVLSTAAAADLPSHNHTGGTTGGTLTSAAITDLAEYIRDTMGTALVEGTGIDIAVNDAGDTITVSATGGGGGLDGMIGFEIDGDGSILATGARGEIVLPYDCTPTEWIVINDQAATVGIDLWKDTFANFPPTSGDVVTGSSTQRPRTTATRTGNSSTLTGWTTSSWNKKDVIIVNVAANDVATKIRGVVFVTRT